MHCPQCEKQVFTDVCTSGGTAMLEIGMVVPLLRLYELHQVARPCTIVARPCLSHDCAHLCTWHGRASIEHGRALVSILAQNCNVIYFKTLETILTCIIQMKGKKFNTRTT